MTLPQEVQTILQNLQSANFEAFAVGGGVRDLLLGRTPKDWDVATSASPEEIQKLFPKSFYANKFGTVTVLMGNQEPGIRNRALVEVEVTSYRVDVGYSDKRHPDSVRYTSSLEEDLARRLLMPWRWPRLRLSFGGQRRRDLSILLS
jgi:tRNA nucleotidyltransferase (CCA-adding enzyme)